jgi:hypothetical protein
LADRKNGDTDGVLRGVFPVCGPRDITYHIISLYNLLLWGPKQVTVGGKRCVPARPIVLSPQGPQAVL